MTQKDQRAPLRDVVEVREMEGENGGRVFVMKLECGCLTWKRKPRKKSRCIPCWWLADTLISDHADKDPTP